MKIISQSLLDTLSAQAKANHRLRQNYDLRNFEDDNSQRMLNALELGTLRDSEVIIDEIESKL